MHIRPKKTIETADVMDDFGVIECDTCLSEYAIVEIYELTNSLLIILPVHRVKNRHIPPTNIHRMLK